MNDMLTMPDRSNSIYFLVMLSFVSAALYMVLIIMLGITSLGPDFDTGGSPLRNLELIPSRMRDITTMVWVLGLSIAFNILTSIGLLRMQRWARVLGLVGYILLAISQLITIFTATYYSNYMVISLVISIVFVIVLNRRAVKQALD